MPGRVGECGLRCAVSSAIVLRSQLNFLQRASVEAGLVEEVERHARNLSRRSNLSVERNSFAWPDIGYGGHCGRVPVLIVESRDQMSGIEDSKGSREVHFAIVRGCRLQGLNQDTRV